MLFFVKYFLLNVENGSLNVTANFIIVNLLETLSPFDLKR